MPENKLTKEMMAAVDNYGSQIKTLKDYVTAVRKMPGMYCGGTGGRGYLSLIREIFQNSVDQVISPNSPANWIYLYYNQQTLEVICKDNGLGIPFDALERVITAPNTSKNYTKVKGEYSSGVHGQGAKVTNALSSELQAYSYRYDGKAVVLETVEGYPVHSEPQPVPNKEKFQGTMIRFLPSLDVLGEIDLDWKVLYSLVKKIITRSVIGATVDFEAVDKDGNTHKEHIVNKDGIVTDIIERCKCPLCKPVVVSYDNGEMKLEAAFCFDSGGKDGPSPQEEVISFCNLCQTIAGEHNTGTVNGITSWFTKYMNNIYLVSQKSKIKVMPVDIKSGLVVSISAYIIEPVFVGQAKEQLANPEMLPFCRDVVTSGLDDWAKTNPQDLLKLCKYFKDIAELRIKSSTEKAKIVTKYQANALTGYPAKYSKPLKQRKEFIIVEGDSAAGSAKSGRDVNTQGIFGIRGKIPNAFRTSYKDMMNNAEIQGIIKIVLGGEYRRNFDPIEDVEWEKILFMADGDIDGAHISSLLLRFFIMYMPQLIQAGKVYKSVPPLYSIPKKGSKDEREFFTRNYDFVRFIQKLFVQNNKVCHANTAEFSSKDMTAFFMQNQEYVYWLESTALTYAVEPKLLEMALYGYLDNTKLKDLQKQVKQTYRFMELNKENDTLIYSGIINDSNTLFVNQKLIEDCKMVINILEGNAERYVFMNGNKSTIYDVMKAFENLQPNHLQRYKGLGEMDAEEIAASTLRPDGDRLLIQYTLEDAKEEIAAIRQYESGFSQLFKHVGKITRQDLLD